MSVFCVCFACVCVCECVCVGVGGAVGQVRGQELIALHTLCGATAIVLLPHGVSGSRCGVPVSDYDLWFLV